MHKVRGSQHDAGAGLEIIVGPETAKGKLQTRSKWIMYGAWDISRGGERMSTGSRC